MLYRYTQLQGLFPSNQIRTNRGLGEVWQKYGTLMIRILHVMVSAVSSLAVTKCQPIHNISTAPREPIINIVITKIKSIITTSSHALSLGLAVY